jgi:formylglycine-generating enzyme required for sulfatase activity
VAVAITLEGAAANADTLDIMATLVDSMMKTTTLQATKTGIHGASGTLELQFANGYPVGQSLTLTVTATQGNSQVGEGRIGPLTVPSGCAALSVDLLSVSADLGRDAHGDGGSCALSECSQAGAQCRDNQTLVSCAIDAMGCPYVQSMETCPMDTPFCAGMSPSAACSSTCSDSCSQGATSCVSGALATCVKGSNGCFAYGTAVPCGSRQSCTGAPGSAACTCNADPNCSGAGTVCAGAAVVTCLQDPSGCWYGSVPSLCPSPSPICSNGNCVQPPSCSGLAANCGSGLNDSCCTSPVVSGGTFYRSYDIATDNAYPDQTYPATVSDFRLDKYEVTVGRFRKFVNAGMGTQASPPPAGSGANPYIANSGWDSSWNTSLVADRATLTGTSGVQCGSFQTWTASAGANEDKSINCITWFEAFAFCAWDGGFLPTEAEWNYAASGGSDQRAYPWSNPPASLTIDCSYANYNINNPSGTYCVNGTTGSTNNVGSESPKGDGKWGQSDLAGNVWEWNLDWYATYANLCTDCADLTAASNRVLRGGSFGYDASYLRAAYRSYVTPAYRGGSIGVRCARTTQ